MKKFIEKLKNQQVGELNTEITGRYNSLTSDRINFLDEAVENSKYTLPYLVQISNESKNIEYKSQHNFSSLGAQAVNNLANKLVSVLFPTTQNFFKLYVDEEAKAALKASKISLNRVQQDLIKVETMVNNYLFKYLNRQLLTEMEKQLIVCGNTLLYFNKDEKAQLIPLSNYGVELSSAGDIIELITYKKKKFNVLPSDIKEILIREKKNSDVVDIYTYCGLSDFDKKEYIISQFCNDILITEPQIIKEIDLPFICLTWSRHSDESYGRSLVSNYIGDFIFIDYLSSSIAKGTVLASDIKYFIRTGSTIDLDDFITSKTGSVFSGSIEDVGVLQPSKMIDFNSQITILEQYKRRVSEAFLLTTGTIRDAERVTAEEIKRISQQLELSLGGVYSYQAEFIQSILVKKVLRYLGMEDELYKQMNPRILSGLEALGKFQNIDKLAQLSQLLQLPAMWPQQLQQRVNFVNYFNSVCAELSIEDTFMYSEEEFNEIMAQQKQEAQEEALNKEAMKGIAPLVANSGGEIINKAINNQISQEM